MLQEQYKEYREKFQEAVQDEKTGVAAEYATKTCDVLEELAEVDDREGYSRKWNDLARKYRRWASGLETGEPSVKEFESQAQSPEADSGPEPVEPVSDVSPESEDDDSDRSMVDGVETQVPDTTFSDLQGLERQKQWFRRNIVLAAEHSDKYEEMDTEPSKGCILYGKSGTGKSTLVKALANELSNCSSEDYCYIEVPQTKVRTSELGQSSKQLKKFFDFAKANQPATLLFDEIDDIAPSRADDSDTVHGDEALVGQLLKELNKLDGEDVVVCGTSNMIDKVDDAVIGPHRLQPIEVPEPDAEGRKAILEHYLRSKKADWDSFNLQKLLSLTEGWTGGDLEKLVDSAARAAIEDNVDNGEKLEIKGRHIAEVYREVKNGDELRK